MKKLSKIFVAILVIVMLATFAAPVFAAPPTGTITINNAIVGQKYTVYRMADLES